MEGGSVYLMGFLQAFFPTAGAVKMNLGHDSMLHVLEARRGRGKSYLMADMVVRLIGDRVKIVTNTTALDFYRIALELVRRRKFRSITSCLEWCDENVVFCRTWDDLLTSHDAVVILDEATRLFDGRKGLSVAVPSIVYEWLKQSRKVRCTVYFVSHSVEWLDKRVTQLLDVFWQVRKVSVKGKFAPDGTPFPSSFYAYGLDPGGVGKVESVNRSRADFMAHVPFRVRVANCYQSQGLIHELTQPCSFDSVVSIKNYHATRGIVLGVDGEELLHHHLERLRPGPSTDTAAPSGAPGAVLAPV